MQRSDVVLAGVDGTAEASPVAWIKNPRNIVTPLHEIAAIFNRNDCRDGVFAAKRIIIGQKMLGQHGEISVRSGFRP